MLSLYLAWPQATPFQNILSHPGLQQYCQREHKNPLRVHPISSSRKLSNESHQQTWQLSALIPKHFASIAGYLLLACNCALHKNEISQGLKDYVSYLFWHLWCWEQCLACEWEFNKCWLNEQMNCIGKHVPTPKASSGADGQLAASSGLGDHSSLLICMFVSQRSCFFAWISVTSPANSSVGQLILTNHLLQVLIVQNESVPHINSESAHGTVFCGIHFIATRGSSYILMETICEV